MPANRWSALGSIVLIAGGIGHFIIVDLFVTILNASYLHTVPNDLMEQLKQTEIDWGYLGKSDAYRMMTGFSLWSVAGCFIVGSYNWIIFSNLPAGHALRIKSLWLCFIFSLIFLTLAIACFIYPAMLGGIAALIFFTLALVFERKSGV